MRKKKNSTFPVRLAKQKIAIANRGEIAVRLISTCLEMGIQPVLLYSSADKNSMAFRLSPEKICIGPAEPKHSYLNVSAVVKGALSAGAFALHPGYGFLSEKAELAKACHEKGLVFIGPPVDCLHIFGNKALSRRQAIQCGLPVLPAYTGSGKEDPPQIWLKEARKIGFPIMIKATYGGGGRGLRIVFSEEQWSEDLASAQREAKAAFGSSEIFIEKYLPAARHIEVQIFADVSGRVFHLWDRDCSLQRKHQKIVEEAPANLPPPVQREMSEAATALVKSVRYLQAGTVEFLYQAGKFYFMELNPRIQVECPVTEMILGIDLIRAQILTAQGLAPFAQKPLEPRGHSIQCRIYAEDMQKQLPVFGPLSDCRFPHKVNCRFDGGYESGDEVPGFYDALIGKLIVQAENRVQALEKMKQALKEIVIFGLKTNVSFLRDLISHENVIKGYVHTRFVEEVFLKSWREKEVNSVDEQVLSALHRFFSAPPANQNFNQKKETYLKNPWTAFSDKNGG